MGTINYDLVLQVVNDFNEHRCTVRETAERCNVSRTTVHRYLTKIMPNPVSAAILDNNKSESHIRGGEATKNKYLSMRSQ